jgi:hypothetical protein
MTIQTNTRTFSKATRKQIAELFPTAHSIHTVEGHKVIRDRDGKMLCTWHPAKRWENATLNVV